MKKTLTVFTPAYNRAKTLTRTYESLCRQTSKDFEWLVVDDGSSDNTRELVEGWIKEGRIPIRYIYQQNQGMHGAHNTAYDNIDTELNTCIDSDDWMPDDAVEKIVDFWKKNGNQDFAGIIGLDISANGDVIGCPFSPSIKQTTLSGFYANGGSGDKKLVYRTDIIKKYPVYPIFEGEKYVGLAYKYLLIDRDYDMLTLNEPLVVVEYQPDGSSNNMFRQYWNNPRGFAFYRKTEMQYAPKFSRRFMACVHYVSHNIRAKEKHYIRKSPRPYLCALAFIPGLLLYSYIKRKNK